MDKGLIKIQELEIELEKLNEELKQIDEKIDTKKVRIGLIEEKINYFDRNLKFAKSKMKKYIDIEQNIEKWKNITILNTFIWSIMMICIIVLINKFGSVLGNINPIINFALIVIGGFISFYMGESNNYYSNKKYLKEHSLEELKKETLEYKQQLRLTYQKQYNIGTEIKELNNKEEEIIYNINLLKNKIKELKNTRTNIINDYIENNIELEELLNNGYENVKTLIK